MADRVTHSRCSALRDSQEHKLFIRCTGGGHCRGRILTPTLRRQIADIPIGQPATAFVIADELKVLLEEADPMPPDGAFRVVVEMSEPVRGLQERAACSSRVQASLMPSGVFRK